MKIAMLFDGLQIGGIEKVGSDYAKLLINLGHDVTIINLNPQYQEMKNSFPKECKFVNFRYPRKLAPEQYAQLVKRNYFGRLIYPMISTFLLATNALLRILLSFDSELHGYDIGIAFAGHFNDLTFLAANMIKAKKKICWAHGALYSYALMSSGYINLYSKIKNVVVLVDDAQEEFLAYNKYLKLNLTKMYNPTFINSRSIDIAKAEHLKNRYGDYLLMVSRFDYPHKDHYTVIESLQILREKYHKKTNLVLVGSGPEEMKVKAFVSKLQLDDYVFFEGDRMDVQNYYASAYLLVHASVAGEGLPTVMIEAMAHNLPMVVTDSKVGPREILQNEKYGLLCRVQDPIDMATKINTLYSDSSLYEYYSNKETERTRDFTPESIQSQLEKLISRLE